MKKITIEQAKAEFPFLPDTAMPFIKSGYDLAVERHNQKKAKKGGTRYYGEKIEPARMTVDHLNEHSKRINSRLDQMQKEIDQQNNAITDLREAIGHATSQLSARIDIIEDRTKIHG